MEFENVKDALNSAMEYAESSNLQVDGKPATCEDFQELMKEHIYAIADLLGIDEVADRNWSIGSKITPRGRRG